MPAALRCPSFSEPARRMRSGQFSRISAQIDGAFADAVERAVVGFPVDPPQPGVAEVGQARAELVAEQPEQAKHRIGVRGGVGHEFDRLQFGLLFEEKGEQHQAVAQGAGNDDAVQAAELVGQQVVPGHAAGLAEILRVRPGMDGARRGGEAHAVRRGDIAGTPDFGERQRGVGGHDPRTGGRDGFRADEVLADPGQALPPECRNILPADRLDADIAGFGDQGGAQAGLEMLYPGLPLAEMGEGLGKAGALHDFQEQVRHAGLWHSSLNGRPQGAQAFRVLQPVERRDDNAGFAVHGLKAQIGVARGPVSDSAVGAIEQLRQGGDLGLGIQRAVERPANHQLGCLPCRAVQHSAPGIAVPGARAGENIAALHGGSPCVDDREHIGPGIDHAAFRIQHMLLPGFRDRRCRRIAHFRMGPVGDFREVADRFLHGLAARCGIHFQPGGDVEEQAARPAPSGEKLRIGLGVTGPGDRIDLGHCGHEIVTGKPLEQGVAPLIQRQSVLFKDQLGHVTQQDRGIVEIAQASQPGLLVGGLGILDEIGDQRLGQFGGVILCCRFERMEQRRHGCRPARFLKGGDRGRFPRARDARQPLQARRRNALGRRRAQIERANGFEPVQVMQELARGPLDRHPPQSVQGSEVAFAAFIEQLGNALALFVVESHDKPFPKTLLRPVPDAAHKTFEDADARQQHLVDDKPRRGALDQRTGVVVAAPAQCIKPSGQTKPGTSVVSEFREAITLADQGEMAESLTVLKVKIAIEAGGFLQTELTDQESRDRTGDFDIGARKDADESCRSQHERKAEAVVVAAQPVGDLPVASVQVEVPRQLIRRGSGGKIGIALPLLVGQVAGGHIVRNLRLLRRVRGARKMLDIFCAKYLCGSRDFSNMFCEASGAPA